MGVGEDVADASPGVVAAATSSRGGGGGIPIAVPSPYNAACSSPPALSGICVSGCTADGRSARSAESTRPNVVSSLNEMSSDWRAALASLKSVSGVTPRERACRIGSITRDNDNSGLPE
eukprot:207888-Prymnesium_polylepis.2